MKLDVDVAIIGGGGHIIHRAVGRHQRLVGVMQTVL